MRIPVRSLAVLALAGSAATCVDVATGPKPAAARRARILIAPQFSASAARTAQNLADFGIQYDSARVVIVRPVADTLVDTTIAFRPGQSDQTLDLTVPVHSDGEVFDAGMQFRDAARVLFQGVTRVPSHASSESAPNSTPLQVEYVGPGSSVVRLQINPRGGTQPTGSATTFSVTGFDAAGAVVPLVPVVWAVSDATIADVSSTGLVRSTGKRGTVTISARTPRDVADQVSVSFTPVAGSIALISGGGQTSAVSAPLASPITIEVRATDNVGLPGVAVSFTPPAGGSATPATATTDASGRASTSVKLGNTAGPQTITVNAAGFSLAVPATALPAGPASLAIASGDNQTDTVRKALRSPLVVKVLDAFSNPVAGATVTWAKSGGGALSAATSTSGADGQASVSYTLGPVVGDESITASVTGVAASVTFNVHAVRSAPAAIALVSGTAQTASVNTTLPAQFVVRVVDAGTFPVLGASVSWSATNGTIAPASTTDADGLARASLKLGTAVGSASATASIGSLAVTFTVSAVPGPVSAVVFKRQPSSAIANAAITPSVDVQLFDAFGNATTSTASVAIALSGGTAGAVLGGPPRNAVNGIATFDDLKVDKAGTGYRLVATATVTGNPQATSDAFDVSPAAAANLEIVGGNGQAALAGGSVETRPSVRVRDASLNPVSGATVTFAPANGSGSVTGGTQTTDATGLATVGSWTVGTAVGTSTLVASVTGAASVNFTANVTPAGPAALVFTSQPSNVVALAEVAPFTVSILDQFGNLASNAAPTLITVAITSGTGAAGAVITGATATSAGGVARFADVRIDKVGVGYRLTASGVGTPVQSAAFNVTTGAATSMSAVAGTTNLSAQVGTAVSAAPAVLVTDAGGNPVAGVGVTFAAGTNSGTIVPSTPVSTGANGIASATSWTLGNIIGGNTATAAASGLTTVNFAATATSGGVAAISTTSGGASEPPTSVNNNTSFGSGPKIQLVDGSGNPVSLSGITVTAEVLTNSGGDLDDTQHGPSAESAMLGAGISITPPSLTTGPNGVADFSTATVFGIKGTYSIRFRATIGNATYTVVTREFTVRAGAITNLAAAVTLPSYSLWGTVLVPRVVATDVSNNLVDGASVIFAVTGGTSALGSPNTVTTDANGLATSPNWTLPNVDATNQVTACVITNCTTGPQVPFTVASTHPTKLVATQGPANGASFANGAALSTLSVQLRDAADRDIALSGVAVTAEPQGATNGPFNLENANAVTTTAAGLATFSGVVIDAAAQPNLSIRFATTNTTYGAITSGSTNSFTVVPGAAVSLIAATATTTFASAINTSFAQAPSVQAMDRLSRNRATAATNNVQWNLSGCPGTNAPTTPLASGIVTASITAGATASSCLVSATASGLAGSASFTLIVLPGAGYAYWKGGSSGAATDWNTGGNWSTGSAPTSTTNVFIPQRSAGNAMLSAAGTAQNVVVEGVAGSTVQINVGANALTIGGNIDASGGGIVGTTGIVTVTAATTTTFNVQGTLPTFNAGAAGCPAGSTVVLLNSTTVNGNLTANCRVNAAAQSLTVNGSLTTVSNGAFDMAGGNVLVTGNAAFNGQHSTLSSGFLEVQGNLTEAGVSTAFDGQGTHTTRLTGLASQTVSFQHAEPTTSHFQNLIITNTSTAGVTLTTDAKALGDVDFNTNAVAKTLSGGNYYIFGTARLHAGSSLLLNGTASLEPGAHCFRDPTATISGTNATSFANQCTVQSIP